LACCGELRPNEGRVVGIPETDATLPHYQDAVQELGKPKKSIREAVEHKCRDKCGCGKQWMCRHTPPESMLAIVDRESECNVNSTNPGAEALVEDSIEK